MCRVDPTFRDTDRDGGPALKIAMQRNRISRTDNGEMVAILTEYPTMPDEDKLRALSHFYFEREQKERFLKLLGSLPVEMVRSYFFTHAVNYSYLKVQWYEKVNLGQVRCIPDNLKHHKII